MLKRALPALALTLAALFLIDRASLLIAPCSEYSGQQRDQKSSNNDNCAVREGVIVAGIERSSETKPEIWTVLATIAIAVFTLTLWLSSEKMWRVTRISTIAARRAANAAIRQAKAAEDALTQLERPYIFVFGVKQIFQDQSRNDFFVTYTVANFGKLPAIIERSTIVASPQARPSCRTDVTSWRPQSWRPEKSGLIFENISRKK